MYKRQDVLNAVEKIDADHIFILPNNKNIILAAQQAAALIKDKEVLVVPTRNVPQGITALLNFAADFPSDENLRMMEEAIQEVHTGMTTFAIRDTRLGDFEIHKDDILGMLDGELTVVGQKSEEVSRQLIDLLLKMDKELFTIYYGEDTTSAAAQELSDYIPVSYTHLDVYKRQVKESQKIDMVIRLEPWDSEKAYDRVGMINETTMILGTEIVCYTIPIQIGRNLAIITEAAAINHRTRKMGYNAAEVLTSQVTQNIKRRQQENEERERRRK